MKASNHSGSETVGPASSNIKMVKENLALSIALWAAAQRGSITAAYVPGKTEFKALTDETVEVDTPLELRDNKELVRCVSNQIRGAFAFSAIQTYRSLESTYTGSPLQEPDPDLKAARCAFYLLNNTMSRDLLAPVWICPPDYRHRFEVREVPFTLDASALDGKEVFWDDFGGLQRYMALLEYCSDRVAQVSAPEEDAPPEPEGAAEPGTELPPARPGELAQMSAVPDFISARCLVGEEARIIAKDFYQAYSDWCRELGREPLPQRSFGMQLTALGFQRRRRGKGRHWWTGVGLIGP